MKRLFLIFMFSAAVTAGTAFAEEAPVLFFQGQMRQGEMLFGFVSVVQTLPEFQAILNYIFSLNMAPFLVLILSINIVGALTGSSSSAIRIGMPMAMQHCIDAGMSLAFVQRLGAFAASILDTLPHSSAIIINLGIADQDMKEAYPPMAVTTILTTAVGTAAVAIFMSLFPSLP